MPGVPDLEALVTLVIVPKEWHFHAVAHLRAILDGPRVAAILYMVSEPLPAELAATLELAASENVGYLSILHMAPFDNPYALRQAAAERVRTPYYAVLGNDTFPASGWLDALVTAAEQTPKAAVVQPIILERSVTHDDTLHVWWRPLRLRRAAEQYQGSCELVASFDNNLVQRKLPELQRLLRRQQLDFLEDHALLVRVSAFPSEAPPLWDPRACFRREFFDLSFTCMARGLVVLL